MRNRFESAVNDAPQALVHPDESVPPMIQAENATLQFTNGAGVFDLTFQIPPRRDLWLDRAERLRQDNDRPAAKRHV